MLQSLDVAQFISGLSAGMRGFLPTWVLFLRPPVVIVSRNLKWRRIASCQREARHVKSAAETCWSTACGALLSAISAPLESSLWLLRIIRNAEEEKVSFEDLAEVTSEVLLSFLSVSSNRSWKSGFGSSMTSFVQPSLTRLETWAR